MFDDIRRNFLMNPNNGLRISAFRHAHINRATDRELLRLAKYLKAIANVDDFGTLNHRHWEQVVKERKERKRHHQQRDSTSGDGAGTT